MKGQIVVGKVYVHFMFTKGVLNSYIVLVEFIIKNTYSYSKCIEIYSPTR